MSTQEFYDKHKNNGGDLSKWDGSLQEEPQPKREPNPSLKRFNYKFANQIEVVDAEILPNKCEQWGYGDSYLPIPKSEFLSRFHLICE